MPCAWCGADGWCFCFSVVDVLGRRWLAFVLQEGATGPGAIMAVTGAAADARPPFPGLALRVGNGPRYTGRDFGASMSPPGIAPECIYASTPEQNGHMESFHKTLKKEYLWPREFAGLGDAQEAMRAAFDDYNNERMHSPLGYMTPSEFPGLWQQWQDDRSDAEPGKQRIIGGGKCE